MSDFSDKVIGAHEEMDCGTTEGDFGFEMGYAVPAQLRFVDEPEQDTERFHDVLEERDYPPIDHEPDKRWSRDPNSPHYDGEVMDREHYSRIRVLVFRGGVVRIYPHDDRVPTEEELGRLLAAIEEGFGAELEHDPIERGANR